MHRDTDARIEIVLRPNSLARLGGPTADETAGLIYDQLSSTSSVTEVVGVQPPGPYEIAEFITEKPWI